MNLDDKIQMLATTIATEAAALGLIFVNGPDTKVVSPALSLKKDINSTNGQRRQMYCFSIAEQPTGGVA